MMTAAARQMAKPCRGCGIVHEGVFDLAADHPIFWTHGRLSNSGQAELQVDGNILRKDWSRIHGRYFLRAFLSLPIIDSGTSLRFSIWSSISNVDFASYVDDGLPDGAIWRSWLSSSIPSYPVDGGVAGELFRDATGPAFRVTDTRHPLYRDQQTGIDMLRVRDLYRMTGHDVEFLQ